MKMDYENYNYKILSVDQIIHRIVNVWPNEIVYYFLKYKMRKIGFNVNSVNSEGKTALEMIVDLDLEKITTRELLVLEALLKFGADPLKRDAYGTTLARKVMRKYRDSFVTIKVLKYVQNIDTTLSTSQRLSALCEVINLKFEKPNVLEYILGRNPDLNFRTPDGGRPLHLAAKAHNTMVSKMLIERGVDVNAQDQYGATPLFSALEYKSPPIELVTLFLENRADMTIITHEGRTLLHALVSFHNGVNLEICRLLLKHGCDPNHRDIYEETPLHFALKNLLDGGDVQHYVALVELFLQYGADLNVKNLSGETLLHIVAKLPNANQLLYPLINRGADAGILNDAEETFLDILYRVQGPRRVESFMAFLIVEESQDKFVFNPTFSHSIRSDEVLSTIESSCRTELDFCIKNKLVENLSISWYSILTSNERKVSKFCRNQVIRSLISKFDPKSFPVYGSVMGKNLVSGLRRFKAETEASKILSTSLNKILPYDAILRIISYVPTMDLEVVSKLR